MSSSRHPQCGSTPDEPLAMDAIAGAIDVATRNALVGLHQVERTRGEHAPHAACKARVTPEPAEVERIARDDVEWRVRSPPARQQGHFEPVCLQHAGQALHVPFGAAERAVGLTEESDAERPHAECRA